MARLRNVSIPAIFLAGYSFGITLPLTATSVVIVRTPQRIVIAADSLAAAKGKPFNMCKIGNNPKFRISFSIAGTTADNRAFSSIDLAESAISSTADIKAAATKFVADAVPSFKQAMQTMRKEAYAEYIKNLHAPEPFQIVLADFENGEPTFVVIAFKLTERNKRVIVTSSQNWCPGPACPDGRTAITLGDNAAIRDAVANPAFFAGLNPQSAAIRLVQTEIDAFPKIVGPPISDLTIDSQGAHWGNKGECQ